MGVHVTRVLVNDWILSRPRTGVGQYLASVIAHWPENSEVELVGAYGQCLRRRDSMDAAQFEYPPVNSLTQLRLRSLSALLEETRSTSRRRLLSLARPIFNSVYPHFLKQLYRRGDFDVFFEPNHLTSADCQPAVATMHDLSVLELPRMHPDDRVDQWKRQLRESLERTRHFVCVSQATADALSRVLEIPPKQITVIPLASRWGQPPGEWSPEAVRRRLDLPPRYLVCLATLEPRKNALRLLDAYARIDPREREVAPLILAGGPGWGDAGFWQRLREHPLADEVLTTGYLTDGQAAAVVIGATALVYPSLYEGFGLPPLEAMGVGTPVLASTAPSIVEVCDDAVMRIDPHDTDAWTDGIESILNDETIQSQLAERGTARAKQFTWEKTARAHQKVFAEITAGSPPRVTESG